jgi:hypothetical protein
MTPRLVLCLILLAWAQAADAATWYAKTAGASTTGPADSCEEADVAAAFTAAAATGDTIEIAAGTCDWTTAVTFSGKSVIFKGQGIDSTIIRDNVAGTMFSVTCPADGYFRWTAMTVQDNNGADRGSVGAFDISCPGSLRVDHIKLTGYSNNTRDVVGFVDKAGPCLFDHIQWSGGFTEFLDIKHTRWAGVTTTMAHTSWSEPSSFGGANNCYVEDSIFTNTGTTAQSLIEGNGGGGRFVVRFNEIDGYGVGGHGADTNSIRGVRHVEVYNNAYKRTNLTSPFDRLHSTRSGSGFLFQNNVTGNWNNQLKIFLQRGTDHVGNWAGAQGVGSDCYNYWDVNGATGIHTGTATAGTTALCPSGNASNCLVDTGANFTGGGASNNLVGNVLRDTVNDRFSTISANDATSITTGACSGGGCSHVFTTGNAYEVCAVTQTLDQPGRGASNDLSAHATASAPTGSVGLVQGIEPWYLFRQTGAAPTGVYVTTQNTPGRFTQDTDYFVDTGGSSGVRSGTLASIPGTCSVNQGYWATDVGTWNNSAGSSPYGVATSANGAFYKCTSADTWTLAYTPYTYPHPLQACGDLADVSCNTRRPSSVSGASWR